MLESVRDAKTLEIIRLRVRELENKIKNEESLTDEEERNLKRYLEVSKFRDANHRREKIREFWEVAELLAKNFEKEKK